MVRLSCFSALKNELRNFLLFPASLQLVADLNDRFSLQYLVLGS